MEYSTLGSTGFEISKIGLGCWAMGGHGYGPVEKKDALRTVSSALDLGINFFDTADVYGLGRSEEILSEALGERRHDVVIATKFGVRWDGGGRTYKDCRPETILLSLEASLRRLKLETIPLYQIHWWDGLTPLQEIVEALKGFQKAGKIRYYGCTNFSLPMVEEAQKAGRISSVQSPFNVLEKQNKDLLKHCFFEQRMGTIAYSVLARGFLSGKYSMNTVFGKDDTRGKEVQENEERIKKYLKLADLLKTIGLACGRTPSQIAIQLVIQQPFITTAIIGAKSEKQISENVSVFDWQLSPKQVEELMR